MKRLRSKLAECRGEILMESVCSMLVFLLLLMVVSMMIVTSLRMTNHAVQTGNEAQTATNHAVMQQPSTQNKTLTLTSLTPGVSVDVSVEVLLTTSGDAVAFEPEVGP